MKNILSFATTEFYSDFNLVNESSIINLQLHHKSYKQNKLYTNHIQKSKVTPLQNTKTKSRFAWIFLRHAPFSTLFGPK